MVDINFIASLPGKISPTSHLHFGEYSDSERGYNMSYKFHQITSVNLILVTMAVLVWKRDPLTDAFVKLVTMETDVNVGELG